MHLHLRTKAVLLLTTYFSDPVKGDPMPLTPLEWGRFAIWLRDSRLTPESLVMEDPAILLSTWRDETVTHDRIHALLARSGALGVVLEKWLRVGLWALTRSDPEYPYRLKNRLKHFSPPIIFGSGDKKLINQSAIAVIGPVSSNEQEIIFAASLGKESALSGYNIASGFSNGVEDAAMKGAIENGGTVMGVLSDNLLRASVSSKYRKNVMSNKMVLISFIFPEAKHGFKSFFSDENYIVGLCDSVIFVSPNKDNVSTWNAILKSLERGWVPIWIKSLKKDVSCDIDYLFDSGAYILSDLSTGFGLTQLFSALREPMV